MDRIFDKACIQEQCNGLDKIINECRNDLNRVKAIKMI